MSSRIKGGLRKRLVKLMATKIDHSSKLRTNIPAGLATASPPLGQQLGTRNINIPVFVKDFNEKTKHYKQGIPLPVRVKVNNDRTYELTIHNPPATYFLKQAAGIEKASTGSTKKEIAGKITLKHLYEIAVIKSQDPPLSLLTLEQICNMLIGICRTCGIKVVKDLKEEEYARFLEERREFLKEVREQLDEAKKSKMLRTT
ncbi:large ribosomal subunit protein uL11m [Prorops nasuta]|uniref:large ribosomal subunit protein uL11m n=1 Tax=Prorops nasuta TaxID=863751 RepID=UPI0034CFA077